jgi:hypothetical protein
VGIYRLNCNLAHVSPMSTAEDLRSRFIETEEWVTRLTAGATSVRESVTDTRSVSPDSG